MSIINLNKEVKLYDAKKNKLRTNFIKRVNTYINSKRGSIKATDSAIAELESKQKQDIVDRMNAINITNNV